jgi:hypothetical protein
MRVAGLPQGEAAGSPVLGWVIASGEGIRPLSRGRPRAGLIFRFWSVALVEEVQHQQLPAGPSRAGTPRSTNSAGICSPAGEQDPRVEAGILQRPGHGPTDLAELHAVGCVQEPDLIPPEPGPEFVSPSLEPPAAC